MKVTFKRLNASFKKFVALFKPAKQSSILIVVTPPETVETSLKFTSLTPAHYTSTDKITTNIIEITTNATTTATTKTITETTKPNQEITAITVPVQIQVQPEIDQSTKVELPTTDEVKNNTARKSSLDSQATLAYEQSTSRVSLSSLETIETKKSVYLSQVSETDQYTMDFLLMTELLQCQVEVKTLDQLKAYIKSKPSVVKNVLSQMKSKSTKHVPMTTFKHSDSKKIVTVPSAIYNVVETLSKKDMKVQGIFRKSASAKQLNIVMTNLSENPSLDLSLESPVLLACLLKKCLKEMAVNLVPKKFVKLLIQAQACADQQERVKMMHLVVALMPKQNRDVLEYILNFMSKVAELSDVTMMNARNLALVLSPNLISITKKDGPAEYAVSGNIVETMLMNSEVLKTVPDYIVKSWNMMRADAGVEAI